VKELNDFKCQICGYVIYLQGKNKYCEVHHIKPLGQPHNGYDVIENMICVCPNHHAMLDYGAIKIIFEKLIMKRGHKISKEFIDYHNKDIFKA